MTLDVYTRADADPAALADQRVAVIGYGNLGSSMARNLAASGLDVVVGNRDDEYGPRRRQMGSPWPTSATLSPTPTSCTC